MATRWHYRIHGRDVGPVDFATLQAMAKEERLFPDDEIRPEDSDEWVLAETVAGLFSESADEDDLASMLADSDSSDSIETDGRDSWYCRTRSDELGPMPFGRLVSMARDGKVARRDQVRHGAHGAWVEARSIDGLFEDLKAAAPAAPPPVAADPMLDSFEIVSDPTPVTPKAPRPALEPILRMEDDVIPIQNASAPKVPAAKIPDTEAEWTCRVLGQDIGPIQWDDMRELVELRQLGPNDRVRKGNAVAWVPAGTIDNLFPKRKKKKAKKKKKLSDDEVMDFLQDEEDEEQDEEEVSSHLAPQRSFGRPAAKASPAAGAAAAAKLSPASPAMPASRPAPEPAPPRVAPAPPPAPRPDLAAALAAASAPPKPMKPKRERKPMGNPFAGLAGSMGGVADSLANAWKPIAGVAAVVVVAGFFFMGGSSLLSSGGSGKPSHYAMSVALWHEAEAVRTSKNQKAWDAFGKRYSTRIKMTAEKLAADSGDPLAEVLLTCYRDYLPKMIEEPISGGDDVWQKMDAAMKEAESLK